VPDPATRDVPRSRRSRRLLVALGILAFVVLLAVEQEIDADIGILRAGKLVGEIDHAQILDLVWLDQRIFAGRDRQFVRQRHGDRRALYFDLGDGLLRAQQELLLLLQQLLIFAVDISLVSL
jgi:hypothetical protein